MGAPPPLEPDRFGEVEVTRISPYQATKSYTCPGCNQEIPPCTGHVVIVPLQAIDLRRHWHTPCWERRDRLRSR